jgi:chromosome segregation ATPase
MADAEAAIEESTKTVHDRVMERREQGAIHDLDKLESEREEINAKLECMLTISPAVLEAYKKRKGEIADLTEKLEQATETLEESKELIDNTKAKWLPKLETLVEDISKRFTATFDSQSPQVSLPSAVSSLTHLGRTL